MSNIKKNTLGLFLLCLTSITSSHPGGRDSFGGHYNRTTNIYHCHTQTCNSNQQKSKQALEEATSEKRAYSKLYDREDWPHWIDSDGDCQNTRAEQLIAASTVPVTFKKTKGCVVMHGRWYDPYSGKTFALASKLDVDHIVPLLEAHRSGGSNWSKHDKRDFANDPENLLVVSASENRQKGARDPSEWMPDDLDYHCDYLKLWLKVKSKYQLAMDEKEEKAINSKLANCP